jgi:hypothetical protein
MADVTTTKQIVINIPQNYELDDDPFLETYLHYAMDEYLEAKEDRNLQKQIEGDEEFQILSAKLDKIV